ncbi:MAG: YidB family protein [Neisseria sp.]|uniref:YidB family protein n=1 Tax=Neisseria sp. TaxID=192066 RepID=UPI0026DDA33C|nr:YidB family protein [Neisseria sp.]MDO4640097.1 YidB family protein [Neisseria sp.]
MGLMDSLIGAATSAIGGGDGSQNTALQLVMQLVQQNGGAGNLLNQLQQGGLGDALNSWVSSQSSNETVSASQIQDALGSGALEKAASAVGVDSAQAGSLLSQYLPQIVDSLTPNGNAADADGFGLDDIARIVMHNFLK